MLCWYMTGLLALDADIGGNVLQEAVRTGSDLMLVKRK